MSGLLQRAIELVRPRPVLSEGEELVFDEESGISREDQKDILAEIDRVARESRIVVTPEILKIQALKRGTLFPLLVNIFSVVLLAAGGLTLYLLFQRGETDLRQEVPTLTTAEGRLIQELKKESEAQILEKNREINQIQERLQEIDREKQDLATTMDVRISEREAELRRALEAELSAEKGRLQGQGISEADITLRLRELETRKTEQYQRELSSFRAQAEEDRRRAEASLAALQTEYQQSLSQASQERVRVLEEARRREEELKSQLDDRTRALEQETQAARQELGRISSQREQEELAAGQLIGLYTQARGHLEARRFEPALASLEAVRQYLNDPKIAALPSMMRRREIELFFADSLGSLIRGEMRKGEADTTSLIAAANLMTELKGRVLEADGLVRLGQVERAEALYREALGLLPEVSRAHEFFLTRSRDTDSARAARLKDQLNRAESAFAAGDPEATLAHYTRALEYLPEEPAVIERLIAQVRQSGFQLGFARLQRDQSAAAAESLARAERLLAQGQPTAAIVGFLELIRRWPNGDGAAAAVDGINRAVAAEAARTGGDLAGLQRTVEQKDAELAALRGQLARRDGEAAELQKALDQRTAELAVLRAELEKERAAAAEQAADFERRIAELQRDLDGRVALIGTLQQERTRLEAQIASLQREAAQLRDGLAAAQEAARTAAARPADGGAAPDPAAQQQIQDLTRKLEQLQGMEARYQRLTRGYTEYIAGEDELFSSRGSAALIEGKLHLNAFLASTEEMFPGLWDRLKRYDEAFQSAGRAGAMREISDILYELSYLGKPEERTRYLEAEARRYANDPTMKRFLEELKELPAGGI